MREEHNKANSRTTKVKYTPNFSLSLDIPYDGCTIDECLEEYFKLSDI